MYQFLLSAGGVRFDAIPQVDGIDYAKSSLRELIDHLLALGLVRRNADILTAIKLRTD